jgi:hypothetical protein
MKPKITLILFVVFIVLLAFLILFEFRSGSEEDSGEKLVSFSSDDVEKIVFITDSETIHFQKDGEDWLIVDPIEAKADKYEVNRLADDFSDLPIERVVEEMPDDLEKYGIPHKEVHLTVKGEDKPVIILVGVENPLDNTFFAKKEGEMRVVLISSTLKSLLEKKVFDFRMKDIFKFDTDQAKSTQLKARTIRWEAEKEEEEWFLRQPVNALAKKSSIRDVLYALSNLKAKEFISEEIKNEEIKTYGLDNPDYEVTVGLPMENQQVAFFLQKKEENVYATSSLSSKIILVEDSILSDLEKAVDEIREKKVCDFFTWDVQRIRVKHGDVDLELSKDEEDKWQFETTPQEEAEKEKIESFLRKIEALEAETLVDPPLELKDYGLDAPRSEVRIWVKEDEENTKEIILLIGSEDTETKKVHIKNARFAYLFRVGSDFLEEMPQRAEDWKIQEVSTSSL